MTGIYEREAEDLSQLHGNITRIRIMAMDDVGNRILTLDILNDSIHILIKMWPEALFAHVFFPAALHANNAEFVIDVLDWPGVVFGHGLIVDKARKKLHPLDILRLTEGLAQLDDIFDLPAGIGIMPQLHVFGSQQTMNAEHLDMVFLRCHEFTFFKKGL